MLSYPKRAKPTQLQPRRRSRAREPLWAGISSHKCIDKRAQRAEPTCPKHTLSADGGWFISPDLVLQEGLVLPLFSPQIWFLLTVSYRDLRHYWGEAGVILLSKPDRAHKPLNKTFWLPRNYSFCKGTTHPPRLLLWECPSLMNKSPKSPSSGCSCSVFVYHSSESCLPGFSWALTSHTYLTSWKVSPTTHFRVIHYNQYGIGNLHQKRRNFEKVESTLRNDNARLSHASGTGSPEKFTPALEILHFWSVDV